MNRGSIPGFYYDEEKKKYFRIQPNHQVAPGAKHAAENVNRETRQAKVRRREIHHANIQRRQTVRRSRILSHPLVGACGLTRQIGQTKTSALLHWSDVAWASGVQAARVEEFNLPFQVGEGLEVADAFYHPTMREMLTIIMHNSSRFFCYCSRGPRSWDDAARRPLPQTLDCLMVCGRKIIQQPHARDIFVPLSRPTPPRFAQSSLPMLNQPFVSFYECCESDDGPIAVSWRDSTGGIAILHRSTIMFHGASGENISLLLTGTDDAEVDESRWCPDLTWLNDRIVAWVDNFEPHRRKVILWDIRVKDGAENRFFVRDRITGLTALGSSGCQLVVSTNRQLCFFDTRRGHQPYMHIPHVHQGNALQYAVNERGLIAALDRDNVVQIYSSWTGSRIGSLPMPEVNSRHMSHTEPIRHLRWIDTDSEGDVITAVQGFSAIKWSWNAESEA